MCSLREAATADFDRFESHPAVVAGLVPATQSVGVQSKHNRGGRDKPGHDARDLGALQYDREPL